jgi:ATP-binding protein involved in chromosome partitioning
VGGEIATHDLASVIDWQLKHDITTIKRDNVHPGIKGVYNIIVVSSSKGGVGKFSTAVNLAFSLAAEGANVSPLDTDIYGPSITTMLVIVHKPPTPQDSQHMVPIRVHELAIYTLSAI